MLDSLTRRLGSIFAGLRRKGRLSESDVQEVLREVRVALLEADVNLGVAKDLLARVKEQAVGQEIFGSLTADQTIVRMIRDELVALLGHEPVRWSWASMPPTVILLCGLQGSGKTTTAAKLALHLSKQGKKPMLAACDVQRPAAVRQLEVLGESIDIPVFSRLDGARPTDIAREALDRARYLLRDVLIVDTAGRTSIDEPLLQELQEIERRVASHERLLVLDAATGQEALDVASSFHERIPLTGAIFSKVDGDARGGAILSVRAATGVPVRFLGAGEDVDALEEFVPQRMAERILGMGDVLGIIERAEQAIAPEEAQQIGERMRSGRFDFNDMLSQFRTMRKMGSIKSIAKMIPGLSAMIPEGALEKVDERQMHRLEAIILSMTPAERAEPDILNGSRKRRVARGSGTTVEDVNALLRQLEEFRKTLKQFRSMEKRMKKTGVRR